MRKDEEQTMPMVLFTFLEAFDWSGKRIIPFCTNEGSGVGDSVKDIRRVAQGAKVGSGTSFTGSCVKDSQGQITRWAKSKL